MNAEGSGVLSGPIGQLGSPRRRRTGEQQIFHEPLNFFAGDHYVTYQLAYHRPDHVARGGRDRDDRPGLANDEADLAHQLTVSERFWADRVDESVPRLAPLLDREFGEVIYIDRLKAVPPVPEDAEHRESAQRPGDVVDQDVLPAEEHRRAQDCVRQARFGQRSLQPRLALEILQ